MGLENFIPEKWSAILAVKLRKALVFGSLTNKNFVEEIFDYGDTVHINEIGPVTVNAYSKNATLTYETLNSAQKTLIIDQASSFSFKIDDIDKAQANPDVMDAAMSDAAYRVGDTIDQFIAGLYAQAEAPSVSTYVGSASSALATTSGAALLTFSYAQRYLTERNVPSQGRWAVIPPWVHQKLVLAETGIISATAVPKIRDDGVLVNGYVGTYAGFELFVSNNVSCSSAAGTYRVLCGDSTAISYGGQVSEVEAIRLQTTFADAARGLYVYGAKVTRSEALLTLYLSESAG
jgi:hypothetical protein